jgi:hypothetical protein
MRWLMVKSFTFLLLGVLAWPARVQANISAPWQEGTPAAEPGGNLGQLEVIREELAMDLRPLAQGTGGVPVRVRYEVRNRGPALTSDLVFVTPGIASGEVLLDGTVLQGTESRMETLPEVWQNAQTPDIDGGSLRYESYEMAAETRVLAFSLTLAERAQHVIEVRYELMPGWNDTSDMYLSHQIAYLLAPARQWGDFGTLDVRVQVPAGWEAAALPALQRQGDTLVGQFQGVPADFLGVTVRRPAEHGWGWILLGISAVAGVVLGPMLARRLGRRTAMWSRGRALLVGLGASVLTGALLLGLPAGALLLWEALLDRTQLAVRYLYGVTMTLFLLGPLVGAFYVILAGVLFVWARRWARREHAG